MTTMNSEIKNKWVTALRSKEYKQGYKSLALAKADGTVEYCCLGVLCELAVQEGIAHRRGGSTEFGDSLISYDAQMSYLPDSVMKWAGLDSSSPTAMKPNSINGVIFLSDANDSLDYDFNGIADLIDEGL